MRIIRSRFRFSLWLACCAWIASCGQPSLSKLTAVRARPENLLRSNGDGTFTETVSGRMWAGETSLGPLYWEEAIVYCNRLRLGGHEDWRLPSSRELFELYRHLLAVSPDKDRRVSLIQWHGIAGLWSSSRYECYTSAMWGFNFRTGQRERGYRVPRPQGKMSQLGVLATRDNAKK